MLGKRKGMFGSPGTTAFAEMVQGVGEPRAMTTQPVDVIQAPPVEKKPGFFGNGGVGWQIMGSIGDALREANGLEASYGPSMMLQRQQQLAAQRQQQDREYDWQDWQRKQEWERANPKPSTAQPYRWEDNAGNVWEYGQDGQPKRIFTDTVPKYYIQGDQALQIPNPYATQGASQNRPKIGETVRLDQLDSPSISNTPAPQTGANGFPATLTRDQYQAVVNQMGQAATDAWMARNNVRLGN